MPLEKQYENVDIRKWGAIQTAARKFGIAIDERRGETEVYGVHLTWIQASKALVISVTGSAVISDADALQIIDNIIRGA